MKKLSSFLLRGLLSSAIGMSACLAVAQQAPAVPTITVYAAGSTTGALGAITRQYTSETGQPVQLVTGPAGTLLDKIEHSARADIFVSANMAHPQRLAAEGKAAPVVVFARNRLCVDARPDVGLTSANLLDKLLDPAIGIGTSTPKADPGGDYAWALFEKAGTVRPGATQTLEAKAKQLVGGAVTPPVPAGQSPVKYFLATHYVDVFIGYCSSHETTPDTSLTHVELPPDLDFPVYYGMTVIESPQNAATRDAAYRLAMYLMSPAAQEVLPRYGFIPVARH
ncbi:molybdate ABC transporter substrate-binding protein [Paraburkholderia ginsengiterrae]|uniref:Molybdate ABC transporter substrate-binding protein n=1 Tax=Paraburkholderia ginsengiterrae TaxID=1462993 RepID=A0A1A9N5I4_9BURK|nr:molybdate ABC transporter substrate-binding protein [Paraburkholderia ginsengiterrae]OAJ59328.1 molybdate ABC transporter substrate-binding protein [Paraburkholderia ginsengiterrae]OAJ61967.1 molybdate ABC transporter substrate-binding protein [Paraburkholderia ginsengiterrae]